MKEYLTSDVRTIICSYMPIMDQVSQMANLSKLDRKKMLSWVHHGNSNLFIDFKFQNICETIDDEILKSSNFKDQDFLMMAAVAKNLELRNLYRGFVKTSKKKANQVLRVLEICS